MSYALKTIRIGETLHVIDSPEVVRVMSDSLQVQLQAGFLSVRGEGVPLLLYRLLDGTLERVGVGEECAGGKIVDASVAEHLSTGRPGQFAPEAVPVSDDILLVETRSFRDYLSKSSLCFFGRYRRSDRFVLGFRGLSYHLYAREGEGDNLTNAVLAARFVPGTTNVFSVFEQDEFLAWPTFHRHLVARIECADHRPETWSESQFSVALKLQPQSVRLVGGTTPEL